MKDRTKILDLIEKKEQRKINYTTKKIFILGPMFNKENCNEKQFNDFLKNNMQKIRSYNTSNNFIKKFIDNQTYKTGNIKSTTKTGKEIISKLQDNIKNYNVVVLLNGWNESSEIRKIVDFIQENDINYIEEKDF